jgi:putative ABC transport system substrate-binding protein
LTHQRHWLCTAAIIFSPCQNLLQGIQCSLLSLGADMRRREFITLVGGAAVAWALAARAQHATLPVIGFLGPEGGFAAHRVTAFRLGLSEAGLVEGRNFTIEYRWAESHYDRLPALATELVHRHVALIATSSTPAAFAAKAATTTIPIVFEMGGDPVQLGLVASLNRPGGNVTGVTQLNVEVAPKRLELLHELLPTASVMALLVNPTGPVVAEKIHEMQTAAHSLGLELHVLNASSERDFDAVFANLIQLRAGGLVIAPDTFLVTRSEQLAGLTLRHGVPTIYFQREAVKAGGLMSYGASIPDIYRNVGVYTGRILKGEKPADLPVVQPTKVEMVINLLTARALGLTIPPTLLALADEVIE